MKKIIFTLLISVIIFFIATISKAQFNLFDLLQPESTIKTQTETKQISESDIILNWETNSFNPMSYKMKNLPTRNSLINLSAQILNYNDTKNIIFKWYLNTILKDAGKNKTNFNFYPTTLIGKDYIRMEIETPDGNSFSKSISIPIVSPEIIIYKINNNYKEFKKELKISTNEQLNLIAIPYFFNINKIKDLNFKWEFNNQVVEGNDNILNLKITKENQLLTRKRLIIRAENKNTLFFEFANNFINLLIQ